MASSSGKKGKKPSKAARNAKKRVGPGRTKWRKGAEKRRANRRMRRGNPTHSRGLMDLISPLGEGFKS